MSRRVQEGVRLLALPLCRRRGDSTRELIYFYAHIPVSVTKAASSGSSQSYLTRATNFGANQWTKLGKAKKDSWLNKIYVFGERLMDRIAFEEWALKALDPALAPRPWKSAKPSAEDSPSRGQVPLHFPKSIVSEDHLSSHLKKLLAYRQPHHRHRMWMNLGAVPLCLPFALIPIVPNFPAFWFTWRSWSHWRAWKASEYLEQLRSRGQLQLIPSKELDSIYSLNNQMSTSSNPKSTESTTEDEEPALLLQPERIPELIRTMSLNESAEGDLRRAVEQVGVRLRTAEAEDLAKAKEERAQEEKSRN